MDQIIDNYIEFEDDRPFSEKKILEEENYVRAIEEGLFCES